MDTRRAKKADSHHNKVDQEKVINQERYNSDKTLQANQHLKEKWVK